MFEQAPAKVNLSLLITGKRQDGYHLLDSLVVFAGAADVLSAKPAATLTLSLGGPFAAGLVAEADNLVLRAARALAQATGVAAGAALHLEKNLPVASGIGGGSADAAAALRLLSRLWNLPAGDGVLRGIAASLGADVPVCVASAPARMAGIGEVLSAAPRLPPCGILLVNPGLALATAGVFRARSGAFSPAPLYPAGWTDAAAMAADLENAGNDLEAPAIGLCPPIGDVLAALRALPGCRLARMSGSGATCFALFDNAAEAARNAASLQESGWWCWGGGLYGTALDT